jgi:hypothetical protein
MLHFTTFENCKFIFVISLFSLTFLELVWKQEVTQAIQLHLETLQHDTADEIHSTYL